MKDLCQGLEKLTNGSQIEKLKFLFKVYDIDGEFLVRKNIEKNIGSFIKGDAVFVMPYNT